MHRSLAVSVAAVLALAAASILMAQETKPPTDRMHRGMQMMKNMDADGNGEISKEEFVRAHEKMFDAMDENGDGTLDQEEQGKMMQKMKHRRMGDMDHRGWKEKPDTSERD